MSICAHQFANMWEWSIKAWCAVAYSVHASSPESCLLSCENIFDIKYAVLASDNRVYDALVLQGWIKKCILNRRLIEIIPGQPITSVSAIHVKPSFTQTDTPLSPQETQDTPLPPQETQGSPLPKAPRPLSKDWKRIYPAMPRRFKIRPPLKRGVFKYSANSAFHLVKNIARLSTA